MAALYDPEVISPGQPDTALTRLRHPTLGSMTTASKLSDVCHVGGRLHDVTQVRLLVSTLPKLPGNFTDETVVTFALFFLVVTVESDRESPRN